MQPTKAQLQQAQKMQRLRNSQERRHEVGFFHADNKAERVITNFTKIPEKILEGLLTGNVEGLTKPKNHTDLNDPDIKKKMESNFDSQDNKETSLADIRRQLNLMREEENSARQSINKDKQDRQQAIAQEEREKEEKIRQQNQQAPIQSTPKQKRGMMGQKRKKTVETHAAFGKQ